VIRAMIVVGQEIERDALNQQGPNSQLLDRLWILQAQLSVVASDKLLETMNRWVRELTRVHQEFAPDGKPAWSSG
jgi:hypothetical protein